MPIVKKNQELVLMLREAAEEQSAKGDFASLDEIKHVEKLLTKRVKGLKLFHQEVTRHEDLELLMNLLVVRLHLLVPFRNELSTLRVAEAAGHDVADLQQMMPDDELIALNALPPGPSTCVRVSPIRSSSFLTTFVTLLSFRNCTVCIDKILFRNGGETGRGKGEQVEPHGDGGAPRSEYRL